MHTIQPTDALLVVDLQNDFCPGGALGIAGGDEIVPVVNALARAFPHVLLTQDLHPPRTSRLPARTAARSHIRASPRPTARKPSGPTTACRTRAARSSIRARHPHAELVLRKGFRANIDSYSAFLENDHFTPTGLAGYLRERGLTRLFLCGLAYDFCVRFSAIDGTALDFECLVIEDATRPVKLPGSIDATRQAFAEAGIQRILSEEILGS